MEVANTSHKKKPAKPFRRKSTIRISHAKHDHHTNSRPVLYTLVNGKVDSVTELENKLGQTVPFTMANGEKIVLTAKENSSMSTEMSMTVIGPTIKPMAMESIST